MKKISIFFTFLLLCTFFASSSAMALTITYSPNPEDVYDLPHWKAYEWGVDASEVEDAISCGATLVSATLTITGIYNEDSSSNVLYVNLLANEDGLDGLETYYDNSSEEVNLFEGEGLALLEEHNLSTTATTITYIFTADSLEALYNAILANGFFSITLDPDCHYYNEGITLTIETTPVPEPATMILFGTGLVAFAGAARKRYKNNK